MTVVRSVILCVLPILSIPALAAAADAPPELTFFRAINFNGPPLTIDGQAWQGHDAPDFTLKDSAFENQNVPLLPETDDARARMIRSSIYHPAGNNHVVLSNVPPGSYTVYLYVWEDNDAQTYSVWLEGKLVRGDYNSGAAGHWDKLGPWVSDVSDGTIEITTKGGHANFSGIEVWKGSAPTTPPKPEPPPPLTTDRRAGYDWWSLKPVTRPAPPDVADRNWPRNEVDRFILARLEKEGLRPSPEADRRTLIRRLSFDLTGLPPSPEEAERFAADPSPAAYDQLVDRLLSSPHYGERWARHWLDVVRFGESEGFERNNPRPNAWRYRDWVIDALNSDLSYDQFVRLQVAGDVLRPDDPAAVAATGYLVAGSYDRAGLTLGTAAMQKMTRQDYYEDLTANVAQTFLALTANCARCHDHKFDPVSQKEYYQLAATLAGVEHGERDTPSAGGGDGAGQREALEAKVRGVRSRMEPIDRDVRQRLFDAMLAKAKAEADKAAEVAALWKDDPAKGEKEKNILADAQRTAAAREALQTAGPAQAVTYAQVLAELAPEQRPAYRQLVLEASHLELRRRLLSGGPAHAVKPRQPEVFHVLARGDFNQPGDVVPPRGLGAVAGPSPDFGLAPDAPESQRRSKLAEWLADPRNPLTARVIVNRLWHYHFGQGIVATPNDFGFNGARPTHPELLDWLASELTQDGWSLKKLHRLIVTSTAYRQSSTPTSPDPAAAAKDADNRLLWKRSPLRLEAEALRDGVLSVSGELNPQMGGPGYKDFVEKLGQDNKVFEAADVSGPEVERRSIYRTWNRSGTNPLMDTLDCPDPSVATPRRTVTTTPLQALSLLNNGFMLRQSERFAERVKREAGDDAGRQIERAYRLAYARPPAGAEAESARRFIGSHGLAQFCLVLFNSNEFVYVD